MGQSNSTPQSVSATPNPPTTPATVAAAVAQAKQQQLQQQQQQQQPQQSTSMLSSITSYFSQSPQQLYGTAVNVKPLAAVESSDGKPVQYRPVVDTPQQAEEVKQVRLARLSCRDDQLTSLSGNTFTILGALSGGMLSALAPNKWTLTARSAPYMIATVCGILVDRVHWNKYCDDKHPLPRWYYENAIPVAQLKETEAEMSEELKKTINEMKLTDSKKGK